MSDGVAVVDAGVEERIGLSSRGGVGVGVTLVTEVVVLSAVGAGDRVSVELGAEGFSAVEVGTDVP